MHASEWCKHSSVTFNFIDDDNDDHGDNSGDKLDILVSFAPSYGPWSITGNHSAALARAGKPSMNLSWITPAKNPADVRHAVLHQFGHALGAPHHLPGPRALTLDTAKIARDLEPRPAAGGGGTYPALKLRQPYPQEPPRCGPEPESVMTPSYPRDWTEDGKQPPPRIPHLSARDRSWIAASYPLPSSADQLCTSGWGWGPGLKTWDRKLFHEDFDFDIVGGEGQEETSFPLGIAGFDMWDEGGLVLEPHLDRLAGTTAASYRFRVDNTDVPCRVWGAQFVWPVVSGRGHLGDVQTGTCTFSLSGGGGGSGPGEELRLHKSQEITFRRPFREPPRVICWIKSFNLAGGGGGGRNASEISATASDIGVRGCTVQLTLGPDTVGSQVSVTWIAHPATNANILSGRISAPGGLGGGERSDERWGFHEFPRAFPGTPTVALAVSSLRVRGKYVRLGTHVCHTGTAGFQWLLRTWAGSRVESLSVSFLAWG